MREGGREAGSGRWMDGVEVESGGGRVEEGMERFGKGWRDRKRKGSEMDERIE